MDKSIETIGIGAKKRLMVQPSCSFCFFSFLPNITGITSKIASTINIIPIKFHNTVDVANGFLIITTANIIDNTTYEEMADICTKVMHQIKFEN